MNKVYKLVWSRTRNMYIAVCEFAKSHSKFFQSNILSKSKIIGILVCISNFGAIMPVEAAITWGPALGAPVHVLGIDSSTGALCYGSYNFGSSYPDYIQSLVIPGIAKMKGATSSAAGSAGYVPAPAKGKQNAFLRGDGTWVVPTDKDTTYSTGTASNLTTGTDTTAKVWTSKILANYVKTKTDDKLTGLSVNGKTITYTKGDGTTGTITTQDTTYGVGTTALLNTGTDTTDKVWNSKALADYVKGESRITADGTFAKKENTAAANITALDIATKNAIKGLSVSGTTITYTKGDGTTGTITTQDNNTTYNAFIGASASAAGTTGLVTAPAKGQQGYVLHGDGTWSADKDTTYSTGTASASGLTKLYTGTGTNTDGTMTQSAINTALGGKFNTTGGTLTGGVTISSATPSLTEKNTGLTRGTAPTVANSKWLIQNVDSASKATGGIYKTVSTSNVSEMRLYDYTNADNTSGGHYIGVGHKADGTAFTYAPTPTASSNTTEIATTAFVKTEGRITEDGQFAKKTNSVATNITALDIATKNAIKGLSVNGKVITYTKGDGTTGTITTQDTNTTYSTMGTDELNTGTATTGRTMTAKVVSDYVKAKTDDKLTDLTVSGKTITYTKGNGTTGTITTQDTTYGAGTTALLNTGTDTTNKVWTSKALADYVKGESRVTADGIFAKKANTAAANITALDTAAKNAIKGLSVSGKTITYIKGDGTTGTITTQDTNTTYNAFTGASASAAGTVGLVTAPAKGQQGYVLHGDGTWSADKDTTYSAMSADELITGTATTSRAVTAKVVSDYVKGKTDDKLTGLSVSGKTITFTKGDGSTGTITTQDTTYSGGTASVLSTGTETTNKLWSSKVLSDFVKGKVNTEANTRSTADTALDNRIGTLTANGYYIKKSATNNMATNMTLLDYQLKATNDNITGFASDITRNKNNISNLNTSVSSALSSVSAASSTIDLLSNTKADASLANLNASGKRVIATAAMNAVQEYMASQGSVATPSAPMMYNNSNSNGLTVNDAGNGSLHVGEGSYVNGTSSIAIGVGNQVNANNAGAFGDPSIINADASYVLGNDDTINTGATSSFVVGNDSVSSAKGGLTFGSNNNLANTAVDSVALGNNVNVTGRNSIAIGSGSTAVKDNVVSVGNDTLKRKIINVLNGDISENSTDAVTGNQLFATNQKIQENTDAIAKKADLDASNIDIDSWANKLGIGTVEDGNTGLVNGDTVFNTIQKIQGKQFIQETGETLSIGGNTGGNTISVSNNVGEGRVITGVITDPDNPYSATNVDYVQSVSENIVNAVNNSFTKMDNKINKLGANASALAALTPASFDGDEKWSLAASVGHYHGETGGAVGAFYRPKENVMMNLRMAGGNGENMVAAGVAVSLSKGEVHGVTKRQLAMKVNSLEQGREQDRLQHEQDRNQIAKLTQHIVQQDEQIAELKALVQNLVNDKNVKK